MFRFSNSLVVILLLSAVGIAVGILVAEPERFVYIPETKTCVFPAPFENKLHWITLSGYTIIIFFQG